MKSWQEQQDLIKEAIAAFPPKFHLRAFPNEEFYIKAADSFVQDNGEIQLYVYGPHGALARGTATELRKEIMK